MTFAIYSATPCARSPDGWRVRTWGGLVAWAETRPQAVIKARALELEKWVIRDLSDGGIVTSSEGGDVAAYQRGFSAGMSIARREMSVIDTSTVPLSFVWLVNEWERGFAHGFGFGGAECRLLD